MAQQENKIVPLSLLTNKLDRPTIVARLLKIWHACNPLTGSSFNVDFSLIDAEGTVIQGTMTVDDSHVILPNMHEGNVYEFYLFRVIPAKKKYGIVSHKWQVRFNRAVIIKPASDRYPEIPLRYFNFCRFEELGKQIGENAIVDAIGRINRLSSIREVVKGNKISYVRTVEIANERNTIVPVSLWGDDINELRENLTIKSHLTVVAFSSLRLRLFSGRGIWGLKTYTATRIYQDRTMPEIAQFEKSIFAKLKPEIAEKSEKAPTSHGTDMDIVKLDYLLSLDLEREKWLFFHFNRIETINVLQQWMRY
ncbi:replication protein A 70 kDa DNA-binding subunit D-like isoform X2 [Carex rostrata]